MSPRRPAAAGGGSALNPKPKPRKHNPHSSGHADDKARAPKGRPLDFNMQMILVREVGACAAACCCRHVTDSAQDTIPELMDKLRNVEPADLGFYDFSDDEQEAAVHVNVKGAVTTRRTRVLKGVKLDKTFEPPSHYMCERMRRRSSCVVTLLRRRTRESVDAAQITEYDMDSDDCHFVEKCAP